MKAADTEGLPRLLLADGDGVALRAAAFALGAEGFDVTPVADLPAAWPRLEDADALLFDAGLAAAGLPAAIRGLRDRRPRLLLGIQTSAPEAEEEIALIELGADFYWAKPLAPRLAGARLHAALRRRHAERAAPARPGPGIPLGEGMLLELENRAIRRADGSRIRLARNELALLRCLAKPGRGCVRREDIAADVLGRVIAYGDRSVDNLVLGLRRKLGMDAEHGAIRAVRGVGYRLVPPDPPDQNLSVNPAFSR